MVPILKKKSLERKIMVLCLDLEGRRRVKSVSSTFFAGPEETAKTTHAEILEFLRERHGFDQFEAEEVIRRPRGSISEEGTASDPTPKKRAKK